jgi:hypothetical protein
VQQFVVGSLRAHGPLQPFAARIGDQMVQRPDIFEQILGVDGEAVAEGGRFGRLDVGVGHGGQIGRFLNAVGQGQQQFGQLITQQNGRFTQPQHVHIVGNIGAGSPQMDDTASHRALLGKGANLSHDVVARLLLNDQGTLNIYVIYVLLQIGQLFGRYQTGLMLSGGQSQPDPAHQAAFMLLRPQPAHRLAAVAPGKGRNKCIMIEFHL